MAMPLTQKAVRNRLLQCMTPEDFALLRPNLRPVELPLRAIVESPDDLIETACFVESGICSIVVVGSNAEQSEVGHVGREGMSGRAILLGSRRPDKSMLVQVAGSALSIGAEPLLDAMEQSPSLRGMMCRYLQTVDSQVAHTILAVTRFNIHQRLARWLLMCHDRVDGNDLPLTHELLSLMLSVRRASVTQEIQVLEGLGAIRATRGNIRVLDRARLIEFAGGCYGVPEREYDRLIEPAHAPEARFACG